MRRVSLFGLAVLGALLLAIPSAFVSQWISGGIYVLVALMWLVPDRRIEAMHSSINSPCTYESCSPQ